jgi:23S rRNA (guanosine2251-2'-O)-methyltransferase
MIIYGKQVCLYAMQRHPNIIKTVYVAKKGILPQELFHKFHDNIKFLEAKWAQSMAKGGNHQGILLEIEPIKQSSIKDIKQGDFVVVLDGLTDVGNIGAIIRTAYALGVDGVVISGIKQLNLEAVARTSAGALLDMPFVIVPNISDVLHELKQVGFSLYGADMNGTDIRDIEFDHKRALIMGSEGQGISKKAKAKLDEVVSIEMKHSFDSLNVNAAAAILIHRMGYAVK